MVLSPVVIHPGTIVLWSAPCQLEAGGVGVQRDLVTNSSQIRTLIGLAASNYPQPEVN